MPAQEPRNARFRVVLAAVGGAISGAVRAGVAWLLEQFGPDL